VLQAAAIGESGQVLVLDMGDPVKIVDLARDMIRLSGRSVDEIRIEFTGLRPGEKLYEELLADADMTLPTSVPRLRIARLESQSASLSELLRVGAQATALDDDRVRAELLRVVPEYRRT
jgi:FlaA1/EpsC-like NDP-sugar epimerase